jgi:hypothetical protein
MGVPGPLKEYYGKRRACTQDGGSAADCSKYQGDDGERPAGYFGDQLGVELDLAYSYRLGRDAELGVAAGAAVPGAAWQTSENTKPVNDYVVQSFVNFQF